jgi:abortive infection bacteriophage resistance protein
LIISNQGINVIAIGNKEARVIEDAENFKRKIHSLGSCNYLKVEPEQHILFACQYYDNRQICIQDQYQTPFVSKSEESTEFGNQTKFEDVYKIKLHDITLRELLLV